MPTHQFSLSFITHKVSNSVVEQRASDGYINATAMCTAANKKFGHFLENASAQDFLKELATDIGIPISKIVEIVKGGPASKQGTWVHPQVAIQLAQWLSPAFSVKVSRWVMDWMSGKNQPTKLPYHLERHMLNVHKIPPGYFSVLQEMTNFLVAPMEVNGCRLPEHVMPDISQAKLLCQHLRGKHKIDTTKLRKYEHQFPDGRVVQANLYPNDFLADFRRLMDEIWMPQKAQIYFQSKAPDALPALDKILLKTKSMPAIKTAQSPAKGLMHKRPNA